MKFQRFIDGAMAMDGGTLSYRVELQDGGVLECGLDCRAPKSKDQRVIFVGASYATLPGARSFERESEEEQGFIDELRDFVRSEPGDELAADFLWAILDR